MLLQIQEEKLLIQWINVFFFNDCSIKCLLFILNAFACVANFMFVNNNYHYMFVRDFMLNLITQYSNLIFTNWTKTTWTQTRSKYYGTKTVILNFSVLLNNTVNGALSNLKKKLNDKYFYGEKTYPS